jgi:hypothetical protein
LGLTAVGNYTTSKTEAVASGRAAVTKIVGVGGIDVARQYERIGWKGKLGKIGIVTRGRDGNIGKSGIRRGTPIEDTPVDGLPEVKSKAFKLDIVNGSGCFAKLGKEGDGIANIRACSDVRV